MKKLFLLIMAVVLVVVLLGGCAAKSKGTVEVVMRDGQKWVHVLGTGVEFPLLGEWENAIRNTSKKDNGDVTTKFTLFDSYKSMSVLEIGGYEKDQLPNFFNQLTTSNIENWGQMICERDDGKYIGSHLYEDGSSFFRCKEKSGMLMSMLFINTEPARGIACIGFGDNGARNEPVFAEMMRRLVVH